MPPVRRERLRIGIDLGGTKISGVVMTPAGEVAASIRVASPRGSYPETLAALTALVADLESGVGLAPGAAPVGIGTPGAWVAAAGVMRTATPPG